MNGYSYLKDHIKRSIELNVKALLEETSIERPPINYTTIYDAERLEKYLLSRNEMIAQGVINNISPRNLNFLRGLLFVSRRQVFVIDDNYEKRNNFVLAHELGHWKLPSHNDLLYKCTQFDLSAKALKQLEREANFYASEISFMGSLFFQFLQDSELTLSNIRKLSDIFNMSGEATIRRAIEIEIRPCAALFLNLNEYSENEYLTTKYILHSNPFQEQFGEINRESVFPEDHIISRYINSRESEIVLSLGTNETPLVGEIWKTKYNVILLLKPMLNS